MILPEPVWRRAAFLPDENNSQRVNVEKNGNMRKEKFKRVSYFSLLKTKGSASFSLASRWLSDKRRLKVKFAVGSACKKNPTWDFSLVFLINFNS